MFNKSIILLFAILILSSCSTTNQTTKKDSNNVKLINTPIYSIYYDKKTPIYSIGDKVVTIADLDDKESKFTKMINEPIELKKSIFFKQEIIKYIKDNNITDYEILLPTQRVKISVNENSPIKGNKTAQNTFVIFSDFQCPYCSRGVNFENEIAKNKDVKVIFKHFPLSFHKKATEASIAVICASNQGKFWEFHDKVFQNQSKLSDNLYLDIAKELELDQSKFMECLTSPKTKERLNKDIEEGTKIGVRGTPTYFLNGLIYKEARTIKTFNAALEAYKENKKEVKVEDLKNSKTVILYINKKAITIKKLKKMIPNLTRKFNNKLANDLYNVLKKVTEINVVNTIFTKEAKLNKYDDPQKYIDYLLDTQVKEPTEEQIKTLYSAYKSRLRNATYDQVKAQLKEFLMRSQVEGFFKRKNLELIKKYNVKPLLAGPNFFIEYKDNPSLGNKEAKNIVFIFSDFQCPYCSKISPIVEKLSKEKNIKVVYKFFPLSFHKRAFPTAIAAYCAFKQDKFWEFHDIAFQNQYVLSEENFINWAKKLKLNIDEFKKCATSKKTKKRIQKDLNEAMSIGVQGTPSMYINGRIYEDDPSDIDKVNNFIKEME